MTPFLIANGTMYITIVVLVLAFMVNNPFPVPSLKSPWLVSTVLVLAIFAGLANLVVFVVAHQ